MPERPGDAVVSVQVVLAPATPEAAAGAGPVTSENLSEHQPSAEVVEEITAFFRSKGFEVGPFVGLSFSATGRASRFRSVFKAGLPSGQRGDLELDLHRLPSRVRRRLLAVTLGEPLDFGPMAP